MSLFAGLHKAAALREAEVRAGTMTADGSRAHL